MKTIKNIITAILIISMIISTLLVSGFSCGLLYFHYAGIDMETVEFTFFNKIPFVIGIIIPVILMCICFSWEDD